MILMCKTERPTCKSFPSRWGGGCSLHNIQKFISAKKDWPVTEAAFTNALAFSEKSGFFWLFFFGRFLQEGIEERALLLLSVFPEVRQLFRYHCAVGQIKGGRE